MTKPIQTGGVLIIKLSALGDFVQALGPMAAIKAHHSAERIVLLTTSPYEELARATGWFDDVWTDRRPGPLNLAGWLSLRSRLLNAGFSRVYDLQTSSRSNFYYRMMYPRRPDWSGVADGCSHPHTNPRRDFIHTLDRQAEQLQAAGISDVPEPTVDWLDADISRFGLQGKYGVLVPGGAAHRPEKRWPVGNFVDIACWMRDRGIRPVVVGAVNELSLAEQITEACPETLNLAGQTNLLELAQLLKNADLAVGNDTGPMHLAAVAGCRALVLFSSSSDPDLCAPRGSQVSILQRGNLADLPVDEVAQALNIQ